MIELLEHNVDTYKSLCEEMEKHNKVALVQATGTGKSYIVSKYIEEHCNNALILVPANAIGDQWNDLLPNTDIKTYQAMVNGIDGEYDLIVADEMHHLGSEVWGQKFIEYFMHNPDQKVIGATATEIRYLDNARDMVEEIFNGVAVRGVDLAEAIDKGILPTFRYVTAYHGSEQDFNEYRDKVDSITDEETRKDLSRRLEMCIENKVSIKTAMYENLSMASHNIIVFLNGLCEIDKAIEMFTEIFPECDCNYVSSKMTNEQNETSIEKFQKSGKQISILFAVDMLNEGVHIKGVDSVVMFRNTESPQVYFQQMGRVLDTNGGSDRVVFDFVCNKKSIKANISTSNEIDVISTINKSISNKKKKIIIKTYSEDLGKVLSDIKDRFLFAMWTDDEDIYLAENYERGRIEEIAKSLGRTYEAVTARACYLGLSNHHYMDEEDEYIRKNYGKVPTKTIARELGRCVSSVKTRARKIGCAKPIKKWTNEEEFFLTENYKKMPTEEIAEKLGKTKTAVIAKAHVLGITPKRIVLTESQQEFINENSKHLTICALTRELGVPESLIKRYCEDNNIKPKVGRKKLSESTKEFLLKNAHRSYRELANETGVNYETVRRFMTQNTGQKRNVPMKVMQIDAITGEVVNIYASAREAAEINGFAQQVRINEACRSGKIAYGYRWEYAE